MDNGNKKEHSTRQKRRSGNKTKCEMKVNRNCTNCIEPPAKRRCNNLGILYGAKEIVKIAKCVQLFTGQCVSQEIIDFAYALYRKMYVKDRNCVTSPLIDAMAGCMLYLASFYLNEPIPFVQLRDAIDMNTESIKPIISQSVPLLSDYVQEIKDGDLLPRFCGWLILPPDVELETAQCVLVLQKLLRSSNKTKFPIKLLTAAAIFIVMGRRYKSQREFSMLDISNAFEIASTEILMCYNSLRRLMRF